MPRAIERGGPHARVRRPCTGAARRARRAAVRRPCERARAAHRHQPEHGLAAARDAHGPGLRGPRRDDGALPPRPAPGRVRGRRPGRPRRAGDRAAAPRAPRRADGGDRDPLRPRWHAAVHDRLRPQPVERREPGRARPPERDARDRHRQAPARLRSAAARAPRPGALRALHQSHPDDAGRARTGGRPRARGRRGVRSRGARGGAQRRRGGGARPRAGARTRCSASRVRRTGCTSAACRAWPPS